MSSGAQVGLLVIEAGFMFAVSFPVLIAMFALGELALFAGQAPCSEISLHSRMTTTNILFFLP